MLLRDDRLRASGSPGVPGGRLVSAQRTEPKTLNWVVATDSGSREVLQRLMADLIHINRQTLDRAGTGKIVESLRGRTALGARTPRRASSSPTAIRSMPTM